MFTTRTSSARHRTFSRKPTSGASRVEVSVAFFPPVKGASRRAPKGRSREQVGIQPSLPLPTAGVSTLPLQCCERRNETKFGTFSARIKTSQLLRRDSASLQLLTKLFVKSAEERKKHRSRARIPAPVHLRGRTPARREAASRLLRFQDEPLQKSKACHYDAPSDNHG